MSISNEGQKTIRAAIYMRVSTEDQVEKYGLEMQRSAIEGIIKSKGQLVDGRPAMVLAGDQYIYKDEGISGTKSKEQRPAFLRMMEDIENAPEDDKPFDTVIVYRIDRFARRLRILLEIIDYFETHDIKFISANEAIDTTTPFGKAMLGIIGVIAELEIETTKARTQAGKVQARNQGVVMGAAAKFGYAKNPNKQLVIFEEEAQTVREIFDLFVIHKRKTQQIADYLTEHKILTPLPSAIYYGKRKRGDNKRNISYFWGDGTVRDILKDKIYLGIQYYNKNKDGKRLPESEWMESPYRHEHIVDEITFKMAQKRLREEVTIRNSQKAADKHLYLLSGLLRCYGCYDSQSDREPLSWTGTNKKKDSKRLYYYQCIGKNVKKYSNVCKTIPFPADEIENFVQNFVKELLSDPKHIYSYINSLGSTKVQKEQLERLQAHIIKQLNDIPVRKQALIDQHREGYIKTIDELNVMVAKVVEREVKLRKQLIGVQQQLGEGKITEIYTKTLEVFAKQYKEFLEGKMTDRQEIYDLIHLIVDGIHVFCREATKDDVIAGRKTGGQLIPNSIRIDLRLPQDMLLRLSQQGQLEIKNDDL